MKKTYLIIITALVAMLVMSALVLQPPISEASSSVLPSATPPPPYMKRKIVRKTKNLGDTATHEIGYKTKRKRTRKVRRSSAHDRYANQEVSYIKGKKPVLKSKSELSIETLERKKQPRRKRKN